MRFSIVPLAAAAVLTLAAGSAYASSVNLVTNGNFGTTNSMGVGAPSLSSWSVNGRTGTISTGGGITASASPNADYNASFPTVNGIATAAYFVDDLADPEALYQTVSLTKNQQYTLTFLALEPTVGAGNTYPFTLTTAIGGTNGIKGTTIGTLTSPLALSNKWYTETYTFTATATGSTELDFDFYSNLGSPTQDLFLTDVSLTATPLPSSAALLLPVFAAFGLFLRRKGKDETVFPAAA